MGVKIGSNLDFLDVFLLGLLFNNTLLQIFLVVRVFNAKKLSSKN